MVNTIITDDEQHCMHVLAAGISKHGGNVALIANCNAAKEGIRNTTGFQICFV